MVEPYASHEPQSVDLGNHIFYVFWVPGGDNGLSAFLFHEAHACLSTTHGIEKRSPRGRKVRPSLVYAVNTIVIPQRLLLSLLLRCGCDG